MHRYEPRTDPQTGERYMPVAARGQALLDDPLLNKGTAFPRDERLAFGIQGLLPAAVCSFEQQLDRAYGNFLRQSDDLERYLYLAGLQDRNEILFYRLLADHAEEMTPIVYTPTVGLACQRFSHIYRRSQGVYVTPDDAGRIRDVLAAVPNTEISVIVATDGEGILGLGDLGAGGMGIPIGKLALYTLGAGIHPSRCLPVCLDVGTGNAQLRSDPLYLGVKQPRLQGDEYYALLDEFVEAVHEVFPATLLQWEDFSRQKAWTVLDRYRDRICSFNDDIQGTGAITLAGVHGVVAVTGRPLTEQRFVVHGAGAGGGGVIHVLVAALVAAGLGRAEARSRVLGIDSRGLIVADRPGLDEFKQAFAADPALVRDWPLADPSHVSLEDVVANFQPTVLVGTSGQPGCFDERVVREMAAHIERPAIFALSNPTSQTEVHPADALAWTEGRAIVATGSPFDPVEHDSVSHRIGQGNNVFCFPGIGLGVLACGARSVTDEMLLAAARAVSDNVGQSDLAVGCMYPRMEDLREVSRAVARAVVGAGVEEGVAEHVEEHVDDEAIAERVDAYMWDPDYLPYRYDPDAA